jgi:hypothetical protein
MRISKLSLKVASQLSSCSTFELHDFFAKAKPGQIFDFCHYHFYYSYPEFGRQWKNGLSCEFHRVETCCGKCQAQPHRNFAGIGSLYLYMNDDRKALILCDECGKGLKLFGEVPQFVQMNLF